MLTEKDVEKLSKKKDQFFDLGVDTYAFISKVLKFIFRKVILGIIVVGLGLIFVLWGIISGRNYNGRR